MIRLRSGLETGRQPGTYWVRRLGENNVRMGQWLGSYWIVDSVDCFLTDDHIAAVSAEDIRCEAA